MGTKTAIEWADATWNPVLGCTKVSPGCAHCYAERIALKNDVFNERTPFLPPAFTGGRNPVRLLPKSRPPTPEHGATVFVASMSDVFHEDVPDAFLAERIIGKMEGDMNTYLVLTKRPERAVEMMRRGMWPKEDRAWLGVSVENARFAAERLPYLWRAREVHPYLKVFVSVEPLLADLGNEAAEAVAQADWVIVGGESGPGHRRMRADWARRVRDACLLVGTPFFFKQWGGLFPTSGGRLLDGREHNANPPREELEASRKPPPAKVQEKLL